MRSTGSTLGFFAGVRALFGGIAFVVRTPRVWGPALVPVMVASILFALLSVGVYFATAAVARAIGLDPTLAEGWAAWGSVLVRIVLGAAGLLLAFFLSMALAQPLSGSALEAIVKRQEEALGALPSNAPPVGTVAGVVRSLRVTLTALAIGVPVLGLLTLVTILVPPAAVVTIPLKFVVTGLLAAYDLLDYPFGLRGRDVGERVAFIRQNFGAVVGFGVSFAALLLLPGMALLLLPFGAAGAARLVVAHDRS